VKWKSIRGKEFKLGPESTSIYVNKSKMLPSDEHHATSVHSGTEFPDRSSSTWIGLAIALEDALSSPFRPEVKRGGLVPG
jgi:hypothetical protein